MVFSLYSACFSVASLPFALPCVPCPTHTCVVLVFAQNYSQLSQDSKLPGSCKRKQKRLYRRKPNKTKSQTMVTHLWRILRTADLHGF